MFTFSHLLSQCANSKKIAGEAGCSGFSPNQFNMQSGPIQFKLFGQMVNIYEGQAKLGREAEPVISMLPLQITQKLINELLKYNENLDSINFSDLQDQNILPHKQILGQVMYLEQNSPPCLEEVHK